MDELLSLYPSEGKEMLHFFHNIAPVPKPAMAHILKNARYVEVKKGKFIRSPLDNRDAIYFIVKGLTRGFIRDEHVDITTWINEEYTIVGSVRNQGIDMVSSEYIQALEDTQLVEISKKSMEECYDLFNESNTLGRRILEIYYRDADERAYLCRLPSAEKRYKQFLKTRPHLLRRVALKYLASYLGMKEETLCRIRSKMTAEINSMQPA